MTFARQTPLMIVASLALSLLPSVTMADTKSLSGRQIMDEVEARHDKPFEFEIQKMTLIDKSGKKEVRDVRRFTREKDKSKLPSTECSSLTSRRRSDTWLARPRIVP